jgi:predicted nucleic acid-binding protein
VRGGDPRFQIALASTVSLDEAMGLYRARPDKAWSLADCLSFLVMEKESLTEALTSDRHFQQAGFHALLIE